MDKKVALITGCSTGIGQEFARQLNSLEWKVYATARRTETLKTLASEGNKTLELNITNRKQIKSVVQEILSIKTQFGANADKTVNEVLNDNSLYYPISKYVHQRANTSRGKSDSC